MSVARCYRAADYEVPSSKLREPAAGRPNPASTAGENRGLERCSNDPTLPPGPHHAQPAHVSTIHPAGTSRAPFLPDIHSDSLGALAPPPLESRFEAHSPNHPSQDWLPTAGVPC